MSPPHSPATLPSSPSSQETSQPRQPEATAASTSTATTTQKIFVRPAPAAVVYDLSVPDQATITVPRGSAWTSGAHWHATHTEFLQVLAGRAAVRLGGAVLPAVGPADGVVVVPRGVVHEWQRSDRGRSRGSGAAAAAAGEGGHGGGEDGVGAEGAEEGGEEEDLVVREWTDPKDGQKEAFFRGLNTIILDAVAGRPPYGGGARWSAWMVEIDLWNLFWRLDNWPVVLDGAAWPGWIQGLATRVVFAGAVWMGWVLGRKGAKA